MSTRERSFRSNGWCIVIRRRKSWILQKVGIQSTISYFGHIPNTEIVNVLSSD